MSKHTALLKLAAKRQATYWPGYFGIGDYHCGAYECHHVSPYAKAAGNVDSKVFMLLQDWSSDLSLSGAIDNDARFLGHTPSEPTNLFPFVKPENMSQRLPAADLRCAAIEFAIRQVKIVNPKLVICIGLSTFNALRRSLGLRLVDNVSKGQEAPFHAFNAEVWCQAHTGAIRRINRNRGGIDRVHSDWARMAAAFRGEA